MLQEVCQGVGGGMQESCPSQAFPWVSFPPKHGRDKEVIGTPVHKEKKTTNEECAIKSVPVGVTGALCWCRLWETMQDVHLK